MQLLDISSFIKTYITGRQDSLFVSDISQFDKVLKKEINGKSVLVIGGAGTIGSSYIKAVLKYKPSKLFVVDTNENGLTELTRDLRSEEGQYLPEDYKTYPMNFGTEVFRRMFVNEGPFEIVANFAAHKHVRSEKDKYSIEAMIENNVFHAKEFLDLLAENKPEHFFCVSTDKAANPVNVMGASKKLMEEVILAYSKEIKITTARFANVAFSNGSLLEGFINRLQKQQPISCPADVKRFFVSPEESGQICMLACILGETGDIFYPKLSEEKMVNFKVIAESFFEALGRKIKYCKDEVEAKTTLINKNTEKYPVFFFNSDTSGEKLYEEFYTENDVIDEETFTSLGRIKSNSKSTEYSISLAIKELKTLMNNDNCNKQSIVNLLSKYIPDFIHIETGKSLDQKM